MGLAERPVREEATYWRDVFAIGASVFPVILPRTLFFGLYALGVSFLHSYVGWRLKAETATEVIGAVLAFMLVLRTNSGYQRWWEARTLWGGIINQTRNLAVSGLAYGPADPGWRERFIGWVAAFPHAARRSLREERDLPELAALLGEDSAREVADAPHMPSFVSGKIALLLSEAEPQMSVATLRAADEQRSRLLDHVGGCERILRTRFPRVHRTMLGQFIFLFLLGSPFALAERGPWSESLTTMLLAFVMFSIEQTARELGNPFSPRNRSHLPLDDLTERLERELTDLARHRKWNPDSPPAPVME